MRCNEKRAQLLIFPSKFSKFRAFKMLHTPPPPPPPPPPPKRHVVLKAFTENKLFYFSKIISEPLRAYF